jgi:DNA polymerase-3 subunit delta'
MTATPDEPDRLPDAPHPRTTAVLHGQDAAQARFLEAAAAGRLHHAWAITGPRGVGKATLAWRIARHLIAGENAATLDMAPDHPAFRQLAALGSPQLFLCRRPWDDKAERLRTAITVDEVRAMTGFFHLSATDGGRRVAIVDAADELNGAAANALLKLLEEPPARAVLLLVCHRPAALLPTLRSRCRVLRCEPLPPAPLAAALTAAGSTADLAGAPLLAALAGGSVGAALRLSAEDGLARYGEIVALLGRTPIDRRRAIALADAAGGRQSARYELTLELLGMALGRLALAGAGGAVAALTEAEAEMAARLAGTPAQARLWAELVPRLAERTAHARAVNLDPAQVILDTLLQIDAAAAKARARAA